MAVGRMRSGNRWLTPFHAVAVAAVVGFGGPLIGMVAAQDQPTPPAAVSQAEPAAQAAPPASPTALPATAAVAEFADGAPHLQAIAQGLVTIDGPVIWRVREITLTPAGVQEAFPASFMLQRSGVGILRNDLTTHRARIEAGEAAFLENGDPYTPIASGADPSVAWVIEVMPQAAAAAQGSGVMLLGSEPIPVYPPGMYDFELQRAVLLPGEVSEIPPHTGPALVMIGAGRVQASAIGEAPVPLAAGNGVLAPGALTVRNGDAQPAAFVIAMLGDPVDDAAGAVPGQDAGIAQPAPTQPPLMQTPVPVPPTMPPSLIPTPAPIVTDQQVFPTPPPP
ncbi:MAG: hypothetical protein ACR2J8_01145, partial [Thermomicrobiales bacterium]